MALVARRHARCAHKHVTAVAVEVEGLWPVVLARVPCWSGRGSRRCGRAGKWCKIMVVVVIVAVHLTQGAVVARPAQHRCLALLLLAAAPAAPLLLLSLLLLGMPLWLNGRDEDVVSSKGAVAVHDAGDRRKAFARHWWLGGHHIEGTGAAEAVQTRQQTGLRRGHHLDTEGANVVLCPPKKKSGKNTAGQPQWLTDRVLRGAAGRRRGLHSQHRANWAMSQKKKTWKKKKLDVTKGRSSLPSSSRPVPARWSC